MEGARKEREELGERTADNDWTNTEKCMIMWCEEGGEVEPLVAFTQHAEFD